MFGRFNEVEDKPGWREKLAEWRDSPLFVWQRPDWLAESPAALACLFVGIALAFVTVMYLVVPADALPSSVPGRWTAPVTTSTTSTTSTTTTTIAPSKARAAVHQLASMTPTQRRQALLYIESQVAFARQQAAVDQILASPVVPPSREWAYAFLSGIATVLLFLAAWYFSDRRARMMFEK